MPMYKDIIGAETSIAGAGDSKKDTGKLPIGKSSVGGSTAKLDDMASIFTKSITESVKAITKNQPGKLVDPKVLENHILKTIDKYIPRTSGPKANTTLALSAINQLETANSTDVKEAMTTIKNKNISGIKLMDHLENRLNKKAFNEVFNELAEGWSESTIKAFISPQVVQMEPNKNDVMDSIVSIAILNDPDLEDQLRMENLPVTTDKDLLENRKIVWQYPPPGTPLDPPYVVVVAVEHQDRDSTEDIVESIIGELDSYQGFKLPRATITKFGKGVGAIKGGLSIPTMSRALLAAKSFKR